jgi:hypothetical protein
MMDTSMNPPVSLHVKTDEKIDPADDLAGEDIPRPSIPDNSTDRKIFLSILEMKASDAGFDGTDEKFALAPMVVFNILWVYPFLRLLVSL